MFRNIKIVSNINETQKITREQILEKTQKDVIQVDNKQKQQVLTMSQSVQLNLIDNPFQQNGQGQAILFNRDGSTMIVSLKYGIVKKEDLNYLILIINVAILIIVQCIAKRQITLFLVVALEKLYVGNKLTKVSGNGHNHQIAQLMCYVFIVKQIRGSTYFWRE
ncbi:unnamed protein product [Paramecium octaurelia]|uniref:Transmembrane protein n=1 Tax=Paramecium octaurelia TaxID=43137 RepID=A0A8S1VLI6_PAROT|nr:unnamed protein product [Paramecium octaurelia]